MIQIIINNYIIFALEIVSHRTTIKTMDSTIISGKRYLFTLSIVDDALDDWTEERRTAMIIDITEIKETKLKERDHTPNETK